MLPAQGRPQPLLEKLDLFEADKGGYKLYRIPGIVITKRGSLLAYCEARRTGNAETGEQEEGDDVGR